MQLWQPCQRVSANIDSCTPKGLSNVCGRSDLCWRMSMNTVEMSRFRMPACSAKSSCAVRCMQDLFLQGNIVWAACKHDTVAVAACVLELCDVLWACCYRCAARIGHISFASSLPVHCWRSVLNKSVAGRVQVLLRWVLQYGVAAVCEAAGKEIDRANVGVFEWELKSQDFKKLSNIKPN